MLIECTRIQLPIIMTIYIISLSVLFNCTIFIRFIIIIIIIILIKSCWQQGVLRLSLAIHSYHPSLLAGPQGCILLEPSKSLQVINTGISICRNLYENITCEYVLASPAVPRMFCSSYLNCSRNSWWVAVQLQPCGMLPPGFFLDSMQYYCVVPC